MSRHSRLAMVVVAVIAACRTVPAPVTVSAPRAIPMGFAGKIDPDGSTTLYLPDIDVIIEARNHRPEKSGLIWDAIPPGMPPFYLPIPIPVGRYSSRYDGRGSQGLLTIAMSFVPKHEGFTFDPQATVVIPDGDSGLSPVEFIGPDQGSCDGAFANAATSQGYPLLPRRKTCFVMRFPLLASPETSFLLRFSGLSIRGDPVPPFDVSYAEFLGNPDA